MTQWIARLSRVHVFIALAAIVCFVTTFAYLQSLDKSISIAQLKSNITAGSLIDKDDVIFVDVPQDVTIAAHTFTESRFDGGKVVARTDLSKSDLLTTSNTIRRSDKSGLQSLSLGIELDRANGGDIKKNDIVDIWKTGDESHLVARAVPVRNVVLPDKRLGISTSKTITIVLAVTPQQAKSLSEVVGTQEIMIVLSNGVSGASIAGSDETDAPPGSFEPIDLASQLGAEE